jgi:hypothetical protein
MTVEEELGIMLPEEMLSQPDLSLGQLEQALVAKFT